MTARNPRPRSSEFEWDGFVRSATIRWDAVSKRSVYPFNLAAVRALDGLRFDPRVTFFAGENGTGKSTILEALAVAAGFNPEGGGRHFNFSTAATHSDLGQVLRLIRNPVRNRDGYFLRAESAYTLATELELIAEDDPDTYLPYGGKSLHVRSHGEAFMALIENRLFGRGLYIFDEPESGLSPHRQLRCLGRMRELILADSQFIIATHSPILLAYPGAAIFQLTGRGISRVAYEDTEHYKVTQSFFAPTERERMLAETFAPRPPGE